MKCFYLRNLCAQTFCHAFLFFIALVFATVCCGQQQQVRNEVQQELDHTTNKFVDRFGVPGISVAIIKDGVVVYRTVRGLAHLEQKRLVDGDTVFSLYSVTKLFVAVGIFQLVEDGKLSVDNTIGSYVSGMPNDWAQIEVRHLLTHSSGLPEIAAYANLSETDAEAKVFQDPMMFDVGSQFRYTQTNYWILRRIIEKLSGVTLQEFILQNQFENAASDSVLFIDNNTERLDVRAKSYLPDKEGVLNPSTFEGPAFLIGAGGLNLKMNEFIKWSTRFSNGELIKKPTITQMWQPFDFAEEKFPMALGWGIYSLAGNKSYGFTGGGRVAFRTFPKQRLTVIVATNGYHVSFSPDRIVNRLAGIVDDSLYDGIYTAEETLYESFSKLQSEEARITYHEIKKQHPEFNLEGTMNTLGYEFLRRSNIETAISIFRLNVQEHPKSWNTWDSLGEALEIDGNFEESKIRFEKALKLNPNSESTKAAIVRLNKRLSPSK